MKIKETIIGLAAALALFAVTSVDAGQQFFSTTSIVGHTQTNSMAVVLNANLTPGGYAVIQHGNLNTTNDLSVVGQMTLDNTNYFVVTQPWHPTTTNAATENWAPVWINLPMLNGVATFTNTTSVTITNIAGAWNN